MLLSKPPNITKLQIKTRFGNIAQRTILKCSAVDDARTIDCLRQLLSSVFWSRICLFFFFKFIFSNLFRVHFYSNFIPLKQVTTSEGSPILSYFVFSLFFFQLSFIKKEEEEKKLCGIIFPCYLIACMFRW